MKKIVLSLIYFLSPLVLIGVLYFSNPTKYGFTSLLIGMILGASAYTWLTWQFILSARPKFIETVFGVDKLYRVHGLMTFFGSASMYLFIGVSVLSILLMVSSKLTNIQPLKWVRKTVEAFKLFKYQHYKLMHNITTIALVTMLIHVMMTSNARGSKLVFFVYLLYFATAGFFLCGPPILMENSVTHLKRLGVGGRKIHFEKFSL